MNKATRSIALTLLMTSGGAANADVCPVKVGEIAQFVEPRKVYDTLKALDLRKSEYETRQEFEARVSKAMNHDVVATTHLLRGTYFPDNVTYVAEREEFVVEEYAWDNLGVGWEDVFGGWGTYDGKQLSKNPWGVEEIGMLTPVQGVGLLSEERVTGTYMASNAMGATVEVTEIERSVYAVFDETSKEEWRCELKSGKLNACSVRLGVPRERARSVKEGLSVGIVARPKKSACGDRDEEVEANDATPEAKSRHTTMSSSPTSCAQCCRARTGRS